MEIENSLVEKKNKDNIFTRIINFIKSLFGKGKEETEEAQVYESIDSTYDQNPKFSSGLKDGVQDTLSKDKAKYDDEQFELKVKSVSESPRELRKMSLDELNKIVSYYDMKIAAINAKLAEAEN